MTDDPRRPPQRPGRKAAESPAATGPPHVPGADIPPILAQDFDSGSMYALRAAVAAHVTQAGMPEPRARDIVLALHELAANAIRHGAGRGRLLITAHDGALHCQVTDDGKPTAARTGTAAETKTTSPDDALWAGEKGHGLWVVHQIADQVSLQSGPGGTIATASFNLPPPGQQRPLPRSRWDRPPAPGQGRSR
jgi:anti-sigma regulatory factor (Ser/Thr protein kinase)